MIGRRIILIGILLWLFGTSAVLGQPQQDGGMNFVVLEIQGAAQFRQAHWSAYAPLSVGQIIGQNDFIRPESRSIVVVLCNDLNRDYVDAERRVCQDMQGSVIIDPDELSNSEVRGDLDGVPYLIYPRGTDLLEPPSQLRWASVEGAINYRVEIFTSDGTSILPEPLVINDTSWTFPDSGTLLPPNRYIVSIQALDSQGNVIATPPDQNAYFRVLNEDEIQFVQDFLPNLDEMDLSDEFKRYVLALQMLKLADLNEAPGPLRLYADSIRILQEVEAMGDTLANSPELFIRIGDIYQQSGLYPEAADYFSQALELARSQESSYSVAVAGQRLGQLEELSVQDRYCFLLRALTFFDEVGDTARADAVQAHITQLTRGQIMGECEE